MDGRSDVILPLASHLFGNFPLNTSIHTFIKTAYKSMVQATWTAPPGPLSEW